MKDEIIKILKRYIDTSVAKKGNRFILVDQGVYETQFPLIASQIINEVIIPQKKEAFEAGREKYVVNTVITEQDYIEGEHRLIPRKVKVEQHKFITFQDYLKQTKDEKAD